MKRLLLLALMLIIGAGAGYAQPGRNVSPEERLKREIEGLTEALSLTKEQVGKITPIVREAQEKQRELMGKMRESGSSDREKMRDERNKIMAEQDKKLKEVLNDEQDKKLDAFRKQQEEERRQRMQQRR